MTEHQDDIPGPEDTTAEAISPAPSPLSSADPLIGTKIGSSTIKRIIGSGGMGTVYEAVQENPRRRIALKMMKRGITSRSATRRFEFESQTLARLKHQGVAQIYEAGTHDDGSGGVPYFVMEYVASAKTITQYADDKKLGTRDRLALR
jgi:serine/threonine protein kinase